MTLHCTAGEEGWRRPICFKVHLQPTLVFVLLGEYFATAKVGIRKPDERYAAALVCIAGHEAGLPSFRV